VCEIWHLMGSGFVREQHIGNQKMNLRAFVGSPSVPNLVQFGASIPVR